MPLSLRQCVEVFHLIFLRALVARGEDKRLFALKGGCNLRFYFGSVRYSEDIDLDVAVVAKETLRDKVERLLRSPALTSPLRTLGIELVETSAPKQTETTQRWKIGLRSQALSVPLRTKIEFSRRGAIEGAAFDAVRSDILRPYALSSILAAHYTTAAALAQKIRALCGRSAPQPRDVFDISLLLARPEAATVRLVPADKRLVPEAVDRAMSLSFDDYASQVVAFLAPEQKELFQDQSAWEAMQKATVERLQAFR